MVYAIYSSKWNKESIDHIKYGMTFEEFFKHQTYVLQYTDMDYARHLDNEPKK